MIRSFDELEQQVRKPPRKRLVLAMAEEAHALKAVVEAFSKGIVEPVLVGHEGAIGELAAREGLDISSFRILHTEGERECAARAVALVRTGEAEILMKGKVPTAVIMAFVLDNENGLKGAGLLSHLTLIEFRPYPKLLFMSDPGLNIAPDLAAKAAILENAVRAAHKLGIERPRAAVIAAVEKVNPGSMPATVDAAALSKMAERGQIPDCIVDGPLALDSALSRESCEVKGITSEVGGDADILLMPDIEAANVFYKTLAFFTDARMAATVAS